MVLVNTLSSFMMKSNCVVQEINTLGGKGYYYECDISNRETIKKVFAETLKKFPTIDILVNKSCWDSHKHLPKVNNAAVATIKKVEDFKEEEVEYAMGVNFFGPYYLMRQILAIMKKQNYGHIISIASIAAHVYTPQTGVYSASKAAIFNLFSTLRLGNWFERFYFYEVVELKEEGSPIKTTVVCPWVVDTGMFEGFKVRFAFL